MSHGLFSGPTLFVQRRILETLLPRVEAEVGETSLCDALFLHSSSTLWRHPVIRRIGKGSKTPRGCVGVGAESHAKWKTSAEVFSWYQRCGTATGKIKPTKRRCQLQHTLTNLDPTTFKSWLFYWLINKMPQLYLNWDSTTYHRYIS